MLPNRYTGMVEPKLARLIVSRARRMRLRRDEIDDLQQQIVPALANFKFDEARSNGASRTTALISVIDLQVKMYVRAKRRYSQRLEKLHAEPSRYATRVVARRVPAPAEPLDLRIDVDAAMARLTEREREVCRLLGDGWSIRIIAKRLGFGRDTINRDIAHIREVFVAAGLRAWVDPNDEQA
ncbi:MAG: sigma-70 family RNA polymerase sigma factor [Planctomycetes bacterium]|nr:sigma-70 family RNA polymerase sigma factor [Planctomycetota bacterium]